ncbi:hypothetical protein MVEN_02432100 [Mycena venus]|uniref:Uncharacterized protein n=1 Tax=Mycena venus TaxID=2733690 RepID=A0A8H7CAV3_9AGAR|nr:hypothetical protein MVEN_02432100 [Mycena venus]
MLESLKLGRLSAGLQQSSNIEEWLKHDLCPFDFSRLAVLSINTRTPTSVLAWSRMASALQTIEALDLFPDSTVVDLSLLPNLLFLRIRVNWSGTLGATINTLSTITSSSHIRQIDIPIYISTLRNDYCSQFDSKITSLPLSHLLKVGLEVDIGVYGACILRFPRLRSSDMLLCTSRYPDWFERQIRRRKPLD